MNGVRSIDDVLQGYRATGHFDPERWFIVRHQGEEIGCLILTDYPEHATWELIYMGLLPARGAGAGAWGSFAMPNGCAGRPCESVSCWPWTRPMNRLADVRGGRVSSLGSEVGIIRFWRSSTRDVSQQSLVTTGSVGTSP